jgi:hypothetical protein
MVNNRQRLHWLHTMKITEIEKNVEKQKENKLKLTSDEISRFDEFKQLSEKEKEELADFIYNISIALYKSHNHDQP